LSRVNTAPTTRAAAKDRLGIGPCCNAQRKHLVISVPGLAPPDTTRLPADLNENVLPGINSRPQRAQLAPLIPTWDCVSVSMFIPELSKTLARLHRKDNCSIRAKGPICGVIAMPVCRRRLTAASSEERGSHSPNNAQNYG
jgi:hypothetical protein